MLKKDVVEAFCVTEKTAENDEIWILKLVFRKFTVF